MDNPESIRLLHNNPAMPRNPVSFSRAVAVVQNISRFDRPFDGQSERLNIYLIQIPRGQSCFRRMRKPKELVRDEHRAIVRPPNVLGAALPIPLRCVLQRSRAAKVGIHCRPHCNWLRCWATTLEYQQATPDQNQNNQTNGCYPPVFHHQTNQS